MNESVKEIGSQILHHFVWPMGLWGTTLALLGLALGVVSFIGFKKLGSYRFEFRFSVLLSACILAFHSFVFALCFALIGICQGGIKGVRSTFQDPESSQLIFSRFSSRLAEDIVENCISSYENTLETEANAEVDSVERLKAFKQDQWGLESENVLTFFKLLNGDFFRENFDIIYEQFVDDFPLKNTKVMKWISFRIMNRGLRELLGKNGEHATAWLNSVKEIDSTTQVQSTGIIYYSDIERFIQQSLGSKLERWLVSLLRADQVKSIFWLLVLVSIPPILENATRRTLKWAKGFADDRSNKKGNQTYPPVSDNWRTLD